MLFTRKLQPALQKLRGETKKSSHDDPALEFWCEFASTYSHIAAQRIEALARAAGVSVAWRPFLLGPIFRRQGWNDPPFNIHPAKGA